MRTLGYVRCSTSDQKLDRQFRIYELCDHVYEEPGVSAAALKRPAYDQVMNDLKPGDVFMVTAIDRVYRSTRDATTELERMHARNIRFKCLSLQLDTTTPDGKLFYDILAAMAEWERRIISNRTKEGLIAAKKNGKRLGRPPKILRADLERFIQGNSRKPSKQQIERMSQELGVCPRTLKRALLKLKKT